MEGVRGSNPLSSTKHEMAPDLRKRSSEAVCIVARDWGQRCQCLTRCLTKTSRFARTAVRRGPLVCVGVRSSQGYFPELKGSVGGGRGRYRSTAKAVLIGTGNTISMALAAVRTTSWARSLLVIVRTAVSRIGRSV